MDGLGRAGAGECIHTALDALVCHIDGAQARIAAHLTQHAVIGQVVALDALDDVRVADVALQLVQAVEKALDAQAVRGELTVAAHDQHITARQDGHQQPGRHPAGLDQILPHVAHTRRTRHIRVTGHDRHAGLGQAVDLLLHGRGIGRIEHQPIHLRRLERSNARAVLLVGPAAHFPRLHPEARIADAPQGGLDAAPGLPDIVLPPRRDDEADGRPLLGRPGLPPLGRRAIAELVNDALHPRAHLWRDVCPAVDHAVDRPARHAAPVGNHLGCNLHEAFPPQVLFSFFTILSRRARPRKHSPCIFSFLNNAHQPPSAFPSIFAQIAQINALFLEGFTNFNSPTCPLPQGVL